MSDELTNKRLKDLENDYRSIDQTLHDILDEIRGMRSDLRSVSEARERDVVRMDGIEEIQDAYDERIRHVEDQITRWLLPMRIVVFIITVASTAALFGLEIIDVI